MKNSSNYSPKIIRLTENDLVKIIEKVILESKRDLLNENKKMEYSDFVEEAQTIHQHPKYIYPLASDITWDGIQKTKKIKIYCPIHQIDFYRTPFSHLYEKSSYGKTYPPKGCPECEKETSKERWDNYMKKVKEYHSIPSKTNPLETELKYTGYKGIEIPENIHDSGHMIKLYCPVVEDIKLSNLNPGDDLGKIPPHGEFSVSLANHVDSVKRVGCPKCLKMVKDEKGNEVWRNNVDDKFTFISKMIKYGHNMKDGKLKYNYKNTEYTNAKEMITVECPKHGDFTQRASSHSAGHGCQFCRGESEGENVVFNYLEKNGYKLERYKSFEGCFGQTNTMSYCRPLKFDFYLPELDTVVEIDGGYHFKSILGSDLESMVRNDKIKNNFIESGTNAPKKLIRIEFKSGKTKKLISDLKNLLEKIKSEEEGPILLSDNYPEKGWKDPNNVK
jgi:hypothetical protein